MRKLIFNISTVILICLVGELSFATDTCQSLFYSGKENKRTQSIELSAIQKKLIEMSLTKLPEKVFQRGREARITYQLQRMLYDRRLVPILDFGRTNDYRNATVILEEAIYGVNPRTHKPYINLHNIISLMSGNRGIFSLMDKNLMALLWRGLLDRIINKSVDLNPLTLEPSINELLRAIEVEYLKYKDLEDLNKYENSFLSVAAQDEFLSKKLAEIFRLARNNPRILIPRHIEAIVNLVSLNLKSYDERAHEAWLDRKFSTVVDQSSKLSLVLLQYSEIPELSASPSFYAWVTYYNQVLQIRGNRLAEYNRAAEKSYTDYIAPNIARVYENVQISLSDITGITGQPAGSTKSISFTELQERVFSTKWALTPKAQAVERTAIADLIKEAFQGDLSLSEINQFIQELSHLDRLTKVKALIQSEHIALAMSLYLERISTEINGQGQYHVQAWLHLLVRFNKQNEGNALLIEIAQNPNKALQLSVALNQSSVWDKGLPTGILRLVSLFAVKNLQHTAEQIELFYNRAHRKALNGKLRNKEQNQLQTQVHALAEDLKFFRSIWILNKDPRFLSQVRNTTEFIGSFVSVLGIEVVEEDLREAGVLGDLPLLDESTP